MNRSSLRALLFFAGILISGVPGIARSQGATSSQAPELLLEIGHVNDITAVAFSPDGKTAISASADRTAKLWDPRTGALLHSLNGHAATIAAVAFSKDGETVFTGSLDGTVFAWDRRTGARLFSWTSPDLCLAMAISPEAERAGSVLHFACAESDQSVKLWKTPEKVSGDAILDTTLTGHPKPVHALSFSPDGKMLASGSDEGTVKLWDVDEGDLLRTRRDHAMPIRCIAFSEDGKRIAVASDDGIAQFWDAHSGEHLGEAQMNRPGDGIGAVAFSPTDSKIATGGSGGIKGNEYVVLWDKLDATDYHPLFGHNRYVRAVAFSPDGKYLLSGGKDDALRLWSVEGNRLERALGSQEAILSLAISPKGDMLASAGADGAVRIWNAGTGELARTYADSQEEERAVAFSPVGNLLASGGADQTIRIRNLDTGEVLQTLKADQPANALAFSHDGATLASGMGEDIYSGEIDLWDVKTGALKKKLDGESLAPVHAVAFLSDDKLLVSGSGYGSVGELRFWDAVTGAQLKKEFVGTIRSIALSPNGRSIAVASVTRDDDGNLLGDETGLWNATTQEFQRAMKFPKEDSYASAVAYSKDGGEIVQGSRDGSLRIWNPKTAELSKTLIGPIGPIASVVFSADGRRFYTAGMDDAIRVWDAGSNRLLATMLTLTPTDKHEISSDWIALTPDGFYDDSPGAARFIRWRVGADSFPADSYEATYHRPDLIRKTLSSEAGASGDVLASLPEAQKFSSGSAIPPQVTIAVPADGQQVTGDRVRAEIDVSDVQPTDRVEILVNGRAIAAKPIEVGSKPLDVGSKPLDVGSKPLDVGSKPLDVGSKPLDVGAKPIEVGSKAIEVGAKPIEMGAKPIPAGHRIMQVYQVETPLPSGESEITLTALAYGKDQLLGRDQTRIFHPVAGAGAGTLYVLSIGVSQYANPHFNLKFAASDADAFIKIWRDKGGSLYQKIDVARLTDSEATSANIRAALFKLLETATESDTVAIFLSGHGVQVKEGEFYFATHEIDATTPESIAQTALPWTAFQTTLSGLKAKRALLFLDACHSGEALGDQQAHNERLAESLVQKAGVIVFASSRGSEYSYELPDAGSGAFTKALVEGLEEEKANLEIGGVKDDAITAEELLAYLRARVPQLTENRQTPSCPLLRDFGEAFPLLRVK